MIHTLPYFYVARINPNHMLQLGADNPEFEFTEECYLVTALVGSDDVYILDSKGQHCVVPTRSLIFRQKRIPRSACRLLDESNECSLQVAV